MDSHSEERMLIEISCGDQILEKMLPWFWDPTGFNSRWSEPVGETAKRVFPVIHARLFVIWASVVIVETNEGYGCWIWPFRVWSETRVEPGESKLLFLLIHLPLHWTKVRLKVKRIAVQCFVHVFLISRLAKISSMSTSCRRWGSASDPSPSRASSSRGVSGGKSRSGSSALAAMSTNIDFIRKKKNNHLFAIDRHNDIERATTSKSSLEHRQREEARIRKETGRNWETKVSCFCLVSVAIATIDGWTCWTLHRQLFRLVGDNWIYDRPLVKRLTLTGSSSLQEQ